MSHSKLVKWYRTVARVAAWIAGADPRDVWASYEAFEEDSSTLFDTVEDFYGSVKWLLEEREREHARSIERERAASVVVPVAPESLPDGTVPEEV